MTRDLGFSERNLMLAYVVPEVSGRVDFGTLLDPVRERMAALPGVRGVTLANNLVGGGRTMAVRLPEDDATGDREGRLIACNNVDPGFFATVGIPLQQGRDFDAHDVRGGRRVAIVSEAMARKLWPQGNAIGQTILAGRTELVPREIVGVARDVSDVAGSAAAVATPFLYLPLRQEQTGDLMLIVATRGSPAALAAPVREALRRMDTPMGSFMFDTLDGRLKMALLPQWFGAWLGGILGVLAFVLAVSGLYGVVAYAVARRTRELGIRVALGAAPRDAVRLVVRQGLVLAAVGVGVGLPLAVAAGALLSSTLYGISPIDPLALTGSALIVTTVAACASYLPARRAAKVDPMIALRVE
jgi:predicted permease